MGHLPRGLDCNGQGPEEFVTRIALFGPENPDQANDSGKGRCKGHPHAQNHDDQHDTGDDDSDLDGFHQALSLRVMAGQLRGFARGLRGHILDQGHRYWLLGPRNERPPISPELQCQP